MDDVPHEIRIVGWDWVTNSINSGALQDQLKAEQYVTENSQCLLKAGRVLIVFRYMGRVRRHQAMTSAGGPQGRKRPRRSSRCESPIEYVTFPNESVARIDRAAYLFWKGISMILLTVKLRTRPSNPKKTIHQFPIALVLNMIHYSSIMRTLCLDMAVTRGTSNS